MGIVNAVDICKYPQHFNRLLLIAMNKYVLFLIFIFSCIGCGETNEQDANTIEGNTDTSQITIAPVTNLKAKITQNPNELYLTWTNPITVSSAFFRFGKLSSCRNFRAKRRTKSALGRRSITPL